LLEAGLGVLSVGALQGGLFHKSFLRGCNKATGVVKRLLFIRAILLCYVQGSGLELQSLQSSTTLWLTSEKSNLSVVRACEFRSSDSVVSIQSLMGYSLRNYRGQGGFLYPFHLGGRVSSWKDV